MAPCTNKRGPLPIVEAKNAGINNAAHGLNNASTPPRNALTSPISTRSLRRRERLLKGIDEDLRGLRAHHRLPAHHERRGGVSSQVQAELRVLGDLRLGRFCVHVGSELFGVQAELTGQRNQDRKSTRLNSSHVAIS